MISKIWIIILFVNSIIIGQEVSNQLYNIKKIEHFYNESLELNIDSTIIKKSTQKKEPLVYVENYLAKLEAVSRQRTTIKKKLDSISRVISILNSTVNKDSLYVVNITRGPIETFFDDFLKYKRHSYFLLDVKSKIIPIKEIQKDICKKKVYYFESTVRKN